MTQTAAMRQPGVDLGSNNGLLGFVADSSTRDVFDQLLMQLSQIHHSEVQALRARLPDAASSPDQASGHRSRAVTNRCTPPSGEVGWPFVVDVDCHAPAEVPAKGTPKQLQAFGGQSPALNLLAAVHPPMSSCPKCQEDGGVISAVQESQAPVTSQEVEVTVGEADKVHEDRRFIDAAQGDGLSQSRAQNEDALLNADKVDSAFSSVFACEEFETAGLEVPVYNVEDYYYTEGWSQAIARSEAFHCAVLFIIAMNAVSIGVEAEASRDSGDAEDASMEEIGFVLLNNFFCVVFGIELLVRFLAFRLKRNCCRDAWFRFDAILVILAVVETWLVPLLGSGVDLPFAQLRLFRLLRLSRMVRLMQFIPELVTLTRGVVRASRATFSSLLMIVLMIYIFAILLRFLLDGWEHPTVPYAPNRDMSTLPRCMWTLLVDLAMMDSPAALLTSFFFHGTFVSAMCGFILFIFMVLSAMMIFNMLIGCMCEVVTAVARAERDEFAVKQLKGTILTHLIKYDNGDNMITKEELALVMSDKRSVAVLQKLHIDKLFLLELQSMLFSRPGAKVPIQGIMELMLMCRGNLPTTVKHMASAQAFLSTLIANFDNRTMALIASFDTRLIAKFDNLNDAVASALIRLDKPASSG